MPQDVLRAAARTMEIVANDLEIGRVRLRLFQHDPAVTWNPGSPDIPFQILNAPPFDHEMLGKMVHPSIREYDCAVIWVHAELSAGGMTFVVAHESRHLWQNLTWREEEGDREQRELDANIYALRDAPCHKI